MNEIDNKAVDTPLIVEHVARRKTPWFSILFIVVIAVLSFYFALNVYQDRLDKQNKDLMQAIVNLQKDNTDLHQQLEVAQTNIQAIQTQQASLMSTVQAATGPIITVHRLNLQAAYLNIQLAYWMFHHQESANLIVNQLDLAKQNLKYAGTDGGPLSSALEDLNDKINKLNRVDLNQALAQIDAVQANFALLSFKTTSINNPVSSNDQAPTNLDWKQSLAFSWRQLKSLLIIQTDNQVGTELVSQASRVDAIRTLNLDLAEAKWYAITNNANYSASLKQLLADIQQYTELNAAQNNCVNQIMALANLPVVYPQNQSEEISSSFNHLMESIERAEQ